MTLVRTTDAGEAARLRAAGARQVRHAHDMVLEPLGPTGPGVPPLPAGLRLHGVTGQGSRLAPVSRAAYAPGHPDAADLAAAERSYAELLSGGSAGPVMEPASAAVTDDSGETLVAAVVVTWLGPLPWGWDGGPWVADIFVVPSNQGRGLGTLLLTRAIATCRAVGEPRIGLSVTDGNPAERLYAALGFRRRRTLFLLDTG